VRNPSRLAAEFLAKGRSDSCPVIDMHGHLGPFQGIYFPNPSPEEMLQTMDRAGVRLVVSSSHASLVDTRRGNRLMAEVIARWPTRFRGYWTINPNYHRRITEELKAFAQSRGFVGFKFHPDHHRYPVTGPRYEPALRYADEHGLLILSHTWGESRFSAPGMLAGLAEKYPHAAFLMGHSGYGEFEKAIEAAREHMNLYLELTAAYRVNGLIEWMTREAGSAKVVFGTDLPWFDPHYGIGCILFAKITDEDRRNILHRNAERLLRLEQGSRTPAA